MLIETGAVVQMALLFGSTWLVNSIVFLAVLGMILLANLLVYLRRPQNLKPWYALLLVSLVVRYLIPLDSFLGMPRVAQTVLACLQVFAPIFFAGVIFTVCFARSTPPSFRSSGSVQLAAASVRPASSSISCAKSPRFDR